MLLRHPASSGLLENPDRVCLYWGGLGYGRCMLRTLPGCCINMLDIAWLVHCLSRLLDLLQASLFRPLARPAKVMATGPDTALWMCPSTELRTSAPCRSWYSDDLLCGGGGGVACCRQDLRWDLSAVCRHLRSGKVPQVLVLLRACLLPCSVAPDHMDLFVE